MIKLSIIIVNYNERERLKHLLGVLAVEFQETSHEVIVVDNASDDGSASMIREQWPTVILLEPGQNLMYGKGNNLGLVKSTGEWLLILNVDVEWSAGKLRQLLSVAQKKESLGVAAPQLVYPDGRIQISAYHQWPTSWTVFVDYCLPLQQLLMKLGVHPDQDSVQAHQGTHRVTHATGACLLLPRSTYAQVGGFDERFTMYLEETEWQKRMAEKGLSRWLIAESTVTHYGSAAKTFAQASPHFLWGLELYTRQHWRGPWRRGRLLTALWTATLISDIVLAIGWPVSWFFGRGQRIRHYLRQYLSLTRRLVAAPTSPPV